MRSVTAVLFGVLTALLLALWLPAFWVSSHVASEDGYVDFTAELVSDSSFRGELVHAATQQVVERAGLPIKLPSSIIGLSWTSRLSPKRWWTRPLTTCRYRSTFLNKCW